MPVSRFFYRLTACVLVIAFLSTSLYVPKSLAYASALPTAVLPAPGSMVHLSAEYTPAHLQGMIVHPNDPFKFDFLIHKGDDYLSYDQKKEEYSKLIKYFLASLTVPDKDQWVNLSPYEHNRIIADNFGKTEMGQDLLSQDYFLKQITSSLMYPESGLGKVFWDKVYARAWEQFHTTNIPVNTFNKVWIVPDQATVYESGNTAYIIKSHLKVMLDEDYLSLSKHASFVSTHSVASRVIKEVLLPAIEKEVNEGKNFALLRQIVSGMILATWYKKELKESLLGKIYADKAKVKGVDQDPQINEVIYQKYLSAFKKGVYDYIKEDEDKYTHQVLPRKYFSGGFGSHTEAMVSTVHSIGGTDVAPAMKAWGDAAQEIENVSVVLSTKKSEINQAMGALFQFPVMYGQPGSEVVDHLKRLMFNYLPDSSQDTWTKYTSRLGQEGTKLMVLVQKEKNKQAISFLVRIYPEEKYEAEIWDIRENLAKIKNINEEWKQKIIDRLRAITAEQIQTITREDLEAIIREELNDMYNSNLGIIYHKYQDLLHLSVLDDRLFGGSFRRAYQFIESQHDSGILMRLFESYRDNRGKADTRIIENAIKRSTKIRDAVTIGRIADFMKAGQHEDAKYYEFKTAPWFDLELTRINGRYVLRVTDEADHNLRFGILPKTDEQDALNRFEDIYNFARYKKMRPRNLVRTLIKYGKLEDPIHVDINAAMITLPSDEALAALLNVANDDQAKTAVKSLYDQIKKYFDYNFGYQELPLEPLLQAIRGVEEKAARILMGKGYALMAYGEKINAGLFKFPYALARVDQVRKYNMAGQTEYFILVRYLAYSHRILFDGLGINPRYFNFPDNIHFMSGKSAEYVDRIISIIRPKKRAGNTGDNRRQDQGPHYFEIPHFADPESARLAQRIQFLADSILQSGLEGISKKELNERLMFAEIPFSYLPRSIPGQIQGNIQNIILGERVLGAVFLLTILLRGVQHADSRSLISHIADQLEDILGNKDQSYEKWAGIYKMAFGQVLPKMTSWVITPAQLGNEILRNAAMKVGQSSVTPLAKETPKDPAMNIADSWSQSEEWQDLEIIKMKTIALSRLSTELHSKVIKLEEVLVKGRLAKGETEVFKENITRSKWTIKRISVEILTRALINGVVTKKAFESDENISNGGMLFDFLKDNYFRYMEGSENSSTGPAAVFYGVPSDVRKFLAGSVFSKYSDQVIEILEKALGEKPWLSFARLISDYSSLKDFERELKTFRGVDILRFWREKLNERKELYARLSMLTKQRFPNSDKPEEYWILRNSVSSVLEVIDRVLKQYDGAFLSAKYEIESGNKKAADPAQLNQALTRGGIDLNARNLAMTIKRDGKGIVLPLAQQDMAQLNRIEGLFPNILEITPATNLQILDELKKSFTKSQML